MLRAWGVGAGCAVAVAAGAAGAGLLPDAATRAVFTGVLAAVVVSLASATLFATQATVPAGHPAAGQRFMIAIAGTFLLHLFAVAAGMIAVRAQPALVGAAGSGGTAGFGLAYASAATVQILAAAIVVSQALRARSALAAGPAAECAR